MAPQKSTGKLLKSQITRYCPLLHGSKCLFISMGDRETRKYTEDTHSIYQTGSQLVAFTWSTIESSLTMLVDRHCSSGRSSDKFPLQILSVEDTLTWTQQMHTESWSDTQAHLSHPLTSLLAPEWALHLDYHQAIKDNQQSVEDLSLEGRAKQEQEPTENKQKLSRKG
jgi:hypothetical protein